MLRLPGFRSFAAVLLIGLGTVVGGLPRATAADRCPTEVLFEPSIDGGLLDTGWTGLTHDQPFSGTRLHFAITCSASTPPCGACTIDGMIPDAAGTTIITPDQHLVAAGFNECFNLRVDGPVTGTVEVETGALTATVPIAARDCFLFGNFDFDLRPLTFSTVPQTLTLGAGSPGCTDAGTARCFCSTCNDAEAAPCGNNADCPPSGGNPGICNGRRCLGGSNAGSPCAASTECPSGICGRPGQPTRPNACADGTCVADGNGNGICAAGPFDLECANHANRFCSDDGDCDGVAGACTAVPRSCYLDNGVDGGSVTVDAMATAPVDGVASPTMLGAFSCQGPTFDPGINFSGGWPGLVRVHQPGRLVFVTTPCPRLPSVCRTPVAPRKSSILLSDREPDDKDRLAWKWTKGASTDLGDFGDPVSTDDYALCLYEGSDLRASILIPAGGTCFGGLCWRATSAGFSYRNKLASGSGISQMTLKPGDAGKAQIQIKGSGADLRMPALDTIAPPLHVQLRNLGNGICWGSTFDAPFARATATQLKDKTD